MVVASSISTSWKVVSNAYVFWESFNLWDTLCLNLDKGYLVYFLSKEVAEIWGWGWDFCGCGTGFDGSGCFAYCFGWVGYVFGAYLIG